MNPKFNQNNKINNFHALQKTVNEIIKDVDSKHTNFKALILSGTLFLSYLTGIWGLWIQATNSYYYFLIAIFLGIMCVPLILVIGHESIHGNVTNNTVVNSIGKNIFYFLGTSPYFWKLRHLNAHHYYTNIRKWDLDIEQSKLIRLDESQEWNKIHKFQAYYMPFLFMFYTLNWFFFRDFKDIRKRQFGTKKLSSHPIQKIILLFCAKIWHLLFLIIIPLQLGQSLPYVLIGFFIFHFAASLTTTLVLVSTHIGENHELLSVENEMPYTWIEHQIRTSGDFSTSNSFVLHFFGGFNHHLTHHLFPNIPYSLYPKITPLVKNYCLENNLPYNNYPNLFSCVKSHFIRLMQYSKK